MAQESVYLCGDEDGGTTLWCWTCGSDADPVAYYSGFCNNSPYPTDGVPSVASIQEMASLAAKHVASHEPDEPEPVDTAWLDSGWATETAIAKVTNRVQVTDGTAYLPNGQVLRNIHPGSACEGRGCPIHHPSDHTMVSWPLLWRGDRGLMERTCPHGVGHPDVDDINYHRGLGVAGYVYRALEVHGCDGCCLTGQ